jgi:putative redox protein
MSTLSLDWRGDLKFANSAGSPPIELHSGTPGVVSPTQALAYSAMACMAMDVVHVLQKGRHEFSALTVTFTGERADEPPRRYTAMHLHFNITGTVAEHVVERAIELSRTKYCSVSNSLRTDIDFRTTFAVHP